MLCASTGGRAALSALMLAQLLRCLLGLPVYSLELAPRLIPPHHHTN